MTEVYLVSYEKPLSSEEFSYFYNSLDEKRREKTDRYRHQADKERCVLAGALLQYVLGQQKALGSLFVQINQYGKPYLEDGPEFSLSHAGEWVGLAIGEKPVGLDIEGGRTFHDKAVSKFHEQEQNWYGKLPMEEKEQGFYRLWTGKESYVKRDGRGLSMDLSTFSIFAEDISGQIYFQPLKDNYYFSLCTKEKWDGNLCILKTSNLMQGI